MHIIIKMHRILKTICDLPLKISIIIIEKYDDIVQLSNHFLSLNHITNNVHVLNLYYSYVLLSLL